MKIKKINYLLVTCLSLSGCGIYNESFDCPIGEGLPCSSVSSIHEKMEAGAIGEDGIECDSQGVDAPVIYGPEFAIGLRG